MKTIYKIFFLLLIISVNAEAQTATWQKWYDYNHSDESAWDVLQTYDGGYVVLSLAIFGNDSIVLTKLNYLGSIEWQKAFGDSLGNPLPQSLQQTSDSGFILAGGVGSVRGFLSRFDKFGNLLWKKYYRKNDLQTRFFDCKITHDEGIIVSGDIYPSNLGGGFVIKTDMYGNSQWDGIYSSHVYDVINSEFDNNFYLLSGQNITKIDSIGRIIWVKNISPFFMNEIVQHYTGFIFATGGSDSINLIKLDTSGNTIWLKSYYKGASSFSMCVGKDQNLLLIGGIDTLIQFNFVAVKVNINGNQIFKRRINTVLGNWYKIPSSVRPTEDYGYVITGYTDYPGWPFNDNVLVVKTDSTCYAPKIVGINNQQTVLQKNHFLFQNYPNPFNPSTIINYSLKYSSKVELIIYSITGEEVEILVNERQSVGSYSIRFNPQQLNLPSGIYLYKLAAGDFSQTKKMLYVK